MSTAIAAPPGPLVLHLAPALRLGADEFYELCRQNRDLRLERSPEGDLLVMTPAGGETSDRNAQILLQLGTWARGDGKGRVFDSSAGFQLPNGATRSPDASWVEKKALHGLSPQERRRFLPLCPAFVIELRSPSDDLPTLFAKMAEYRDNGARLGWLIDPLELRIHVFRPGLPAESLDRPERIAAAPELPGFELELAEVWDPAW